MSNRDMTRSASPRGLTPLSEAMNQLFRDAFTLPAVGAGLSASGLGLNLYETPDGYILQVLLPGAQPDALDITVHETVLTLQGKTAIAVPEGARALLVSADSGDFRHQVQLPGEVDAEQATADYRDGVLTLTLPKAAQARVHAIKVGGSPVAAQAIEGETTTTTTATKPKKRTAR